MKTLLIVSIALGCLVATSAQQVLAQGSGGAVRVEVNLGGATAGTSFVGNGDVAFGPPNAGESQTVISYQAKVDPGNPFGIPNPLNVSGSGRVRFVADLVAKGANGRDGTPLFDPQPLRLEGTLNVRNGQPIVDDSLSFDLLDDVPADVDLVTGATLQIIRHPVRGLGTVPSEVGVTLAQAGQIIGSTLPSQANVRFSRVGGPMSVEFLAQPDNQLSATLGPDPILVQATGRLSLLADFGLVSPVAGPFSLRLAGRADVDDNGQIIANNRLNFTLFPPGIPQPAGISGLQIVRHGLNPEPGTLALLSIGALALVRRRARSA